MDWLYLGSVGASSGILLMWDNRVVDKVEEVVGRFSVSCKFKNVVDHCDWAFTGVYGPNSDRDRSLLWEELFGLCSWWGVPWCVAGDFNVVQFPSECSSSANFTSAMHRFLAFVSEQSLIDLPLVGGNFTWSNFREVASRSRLDRFLLSVNWEEKFPSICQRRLSRLLSDHFSILLKGVNLHGGKKPFRFENRWLKDEGFLERVCSWWESYHFHGSPNFYLVNKLKMLKLDLKRWNVEELEKSILLEEICWRRKSRALFLKEGDRNTKVFHRIANSHRRCNTIDRLIVDEELSTDQGIIEGCITHFYRQLYSENEVHRPLLDEVVFSSIFEEDAT